MSQRHCINHKDTPAIGQCHQCHKPICEACRYDEAPEGLFCSSTCYDHYLAYHSRRQPVVRGSRLKSMAIGCAIVLAAAIGLAGVAQFVLGIPVLQWVRRLIP